MGSALAGRLGPATGIRAELYMDDGEAALPLLAEHRESIEQAITEPIEWEPLANSKASRIAVYLDPADPADRDRWPGYRKWALDALGQLRAVLQPHVKPIG